MQESNGNMNRNLIAKFFLSLFFLCTAASLYAGIWDMPEGDWVAADSPVTMRIGQQNTVYFGRNGVSSINKYKVDVMGNVRSEFWSTIRLSEDIKDESSADASITKASMIVFAFVSSSQLEVYIYEAGKVKEVIKFKKTKIKESFPVL